MGGELSRYGVSNMFFALAGQYPEYQLARVITQYKGAYKVVSEQGETLAEVSGRFNYEANDPTNYPAVGDYVMISYESGATRAIIHHILTRKTIFQRTAVGVSEQSQIIATNIDVVFLCMSLNNNFNLSRLERYLAIAWDSGAKPIILLTKSDLAGNELDIMIKQVESVALYTDIITISVYDEDVEEKFAQFITEGVTAAFIGSSGVGKSTIINRLIGTDSIITQEVGAGDKGRHTTTGREIFTLPTGGVVIDTAGMREIGVDSADLSRSFADIEELASECRFADCSHTSEPGCAVQRAIRDGDLDARRFDNYLKIKTESSYEGLSAKEIEAQKLNRMFAEVGGMKSSRKAIRETAKRKGMDK